LTGFTIGALTAALVILAAVAIGPDLLALVSRRSGDGRDHLSDPGRELRAERRAEQLLASVLGEEAYEAYRALGFLHAYGPPDEDGIPRYGYLIYPHKPIVSFDAATGELLN
jgi:hypothetical protein